MSSETKHMVKKNTLVPALRFKEFDGVWMENTLGNLFTFKNGLNSDKEKYGSGIKFINVLDIIGNNVITYDSIIGNVEVTDKELEKNEVIYGDVLFQRSSETREEVGQANIYVDKSNNAVFGGFVIRGRKKQDYDPYFINYLLKTSPARKEITTKSGGSTRYNVGQESLSQVFVTLPSLPEQQKIASFLSAVDEKIQQLTKKKELLEHYKKGVMQQLFSGKLRFKDATSTGLSAGNGKDFPDWEEKRLRDMLKMVVDNRGKTPPIEDEGYPMIEINAVGSRSIKFSVISKFVSQNTFDTWFRKYLKTGDILFSTVGATAICSIYTGEKQAVIAQNLVGLRFKVEDSVFMFYLLTEARNNHKFKRIEMGAVQPSVKVSQMIDIKFKVPCFEEQQKIATYLSSIDTKIESVNQQITQTQTFKKGLLQQMFV